MADTALRLVLLGIDRSASKALKGVGREVHNTESKMGKLGKLGKGAALGLAAGLATAGVAAVDFGADSLKAFADANKSQKQLEDAYKRFPKVQNVSIESMRKYNEQLQRKRGIDADDTAAAQAQLGAYKLTGSQIKAMTPLLQDYATKTGKDLPAAAKDLGKAVMGQGKALKGLGIDFKDAKDPAKNYAQVMAGLREKVGGFADSLPEAEKKQKILQESFGDLQETVGEKLQPVMLGLIDAGLGVMDWLDQNPELVEGVSTAFDGLGGMLRWFWNKALLPLVKFWVTGNAKIVETIGGVLEATGKMTGNKDLENFGKGIKGAATATAEWVAGLQEIPDQVVPKVDVEARKAEEKTKRIDKKIAELSKKKVKLQSEGDTKGVDKVERAIKKLERRKAKVEVGVGFTRKGPQVMKVATVGGGTKRISLNASGHPAFPGGLTWLGDGMGHSPELVQLPTGSRILSNGQSRAAQNQARTGGGGQGGNVFITVKGDTNPNAAARAIHRKLGQTTTAYGPGWKPVKGRR